MTDDLDRLDVLAAAAIEASHLIETGENRAMATDGPVPHFRGELDDREWRQLWVALSKVRDADLSSLVAAVRERDELRDVILNGGLRVPGFDHWRERASSKPSDPDDVRWDCSCGYSGSPEKVQKHWAALHREDGA